MVCAFISYEINIENYEKDNEKKNSRYNIIHDNY